jgi:hypothetical protein
MAEPLWQRRPLISAMSDAAKALADECQRQSENCSYTAVTFTIWLRCLCGIRTFATVAPIIFGALATWKIVAMNAPTWGAVFVLMATVIPPAYRASRVEIAIEDYTGLTGEFTNLRDRFRQAALVTARKGLQELEAESKALMEHLEKARRRMLVPPEWCFKLARRKHRAGHYRHDYDVEQRGGQ